ncbi:hypothetical protein ACIGXA_23015 [Streptomyces fildesensis]|uniref:Uncharacterized protein n=1 Tax=Streptomyces fildesensis TaxID=375757 RepID=A0ABW8CDE5_9ACTN
MTFTRLRACATAGAALAALTLGSGQALATTPHAPHPLHYTVVDLGTLGGTISSGIALDADTVVGSSTLPGNTDFHAFAYDRATRTTTDLGTLGGTSSSTVAVQGRYVIGDSTTADGNEHAFVYDLRTHHMTDLGTFGGTGSHVNAISGDTVVGSARTTGNQGEHAFAYDVRTGRMTDLGSLAGPSGVSSAAGISQGRFITGTSDVTTAPDTTQHAFLYDLRTHRMTDLGADGGASSQATAISGNTVVGITRTGSAPAPGAAHGFAYDIRTRAWTDLGDHMIAHLQVSGHTAAGTDGHTAYTVDLTTGVRTQLGLGQGSTGVNGITGRVVVGETNPGPLAFAYRTDTHSSTLLPAPGGLYSTATSADEQGAVAGTAATTTDPDTVNSSYHAVLWIPSRH